MIFDSWQFVVVALAGWLNRQQRDVVEYLREENRVLREQLKGKRIRFTDDQRRRLATKGKRLGRKVFAGVCALLTAPPDELPALLAWSLWRRRQTHARQCHYRARSSRAP